MKVRSGIDTVHIPRIVKSISRLGDAFLDRCFTAAEKEYALSFKAEARRAEIYAGRFAAKEAFAKAVGTGILTDSLALTDVEILTDANGSPKLVLHGKAQKLAEELKVSSASVSITHEKDYAAAVCVLLTDEEV